MAYKRLLLAGFLLAAIVLTGCHAAGRTSVRGEYYYPPYYYPPSYYALSYDPSYYPSSYSPCYGPYYPYYPCSRYPAFSVSFFYSDFFFPYTRVILIDGPRRGLRGRGLILGGSSSGRRLR